MQSSVRELAELVMRPLASHSRGQGEMLSDTSQTIPLKHSLMPSVAYACGLVK